MSLIFVASSNSLEMSNCAQSMSLPIVCNALRIAGELNFVASSYAIEVTPMSEYFTKRLISCDSLKLNVVEFLVDVCVNFTPFAEMKCG